MEEEYSSSEDEDCPLFGTAMSGVTLEDEEEDDGGGVGGPVRGGPPRRPPPRRASAPPAVAAPPHRSGYIGESFVNVICFRQKISLPEFR